MKPIDWIVGGLIFISGYIAYLQNYKKKEDVACKRKARIGYGMMVIGAILTVGRWVISLNYVN